MSEEPPDHELEKLEHRVPTTRRRVVPSAVVAVLLAALSGCGGGDPEPGDIASCLEEAGFENVNVGPSGASGDRFGQEFGVVQYATEEEAQDHADTLSGSDLLDYIVEHEGTTVTTWIGDPGDEARDAGADCAV